MTEDLQQLLEKIQHDGVDKAQSESSAIIEKAKSEAASLIAAAKAEAEKIKSDAQTEADAYATRAGETISQSARDVLLHVEKSVTTLLESLLLKDVNTALSNEEIVATLIQEAVKTYLTAEESIEVSVVEQMVESLRAKLASLAAEGVTVVTDKTTGTGFSIKLAGGRVEHDFSGAAVTDALSKQLRPGLAALLKS
ncbi:MAG: hypothetical protein PF904_08845 [Kiritimatiellae bacterium]|jgi:V/A-type H+-transporting ATPase subunit E|nr:hypothetical protein [Kiritimatiellia bacterium]